MRTYRRVDHKHRNIREDAFSGIAPWKIFVKSVRFKSINILPIQTLASASLKKELIHHILTINLQSASEVEAEASLIERDKTTESMRFISTCEMLVVVGFNRWRPTCTLGQSDISPKHSRFAKEQQLF